MDSPLNSSLYIKIDSEEFLYIRGLHILKYQGKNANADYDCYFKKSTIILDLSFSMTKCSWTFENVPFFKFKFSRQLSIELYKTQT